MLATLLKLAMLPLVYLMFCHTGTRRQHCRMWLGHLKQGQVLSAMIFRENFAMEIGYNKPVKIDFFMSSEAPQFGTGSNKSWNSEFCHDKTESKSLKKKKKKPTRHSNLEGRQRLTYRGFDSL